VEAESVVLRIIRGNGETVVAEAGGNLCGYFARKAADLFDSCIRKGVRTFVME
jgi:hypothetical protein